MTKPSGAPRPSRGRGASNGRPVRVSGTSDGRAPAPIRRRRSTAQRVLLGLGSVTAVVLLVAAGIVWDITNKLDMIPRLGADTELDEAGDDKPRNYLVVGSDSREQLDEDAEDAGSYLGADAPGGQRADVIMVVRVDPGGQRLDVLSFPRDLWVPISGTDGRERINSAYAGGPQQLIDTIRDNFDIEINHYVEIDFQGFKGIVETVGGVPMYFDRPMRDGHSGLVVEEAGCVTLDGTQALAFARARNLEYLDEDGTWSTDPTGDLGRIERQQVFMRRMFDKVASSVGLTDVGDLRALLDVAVDNVTIDRGLEVTKAVNVVRQFGTFEGESIVTHSLPVEGFTTAGGASVLRVDPLAALPVLNAFRDEPVTDLDPSMVSVSVENGSGVEGQAGEAVEALEGAGFTVAGSGNADEAYDETTVRFASLGEPAARAVARWIDGGALLVEDASLEPGSVVLETGADFTGLRSSPVAADDASIVVGSVDDAVGSTGGASGPDGDGADGGAASDDTDGSGAEPPVESPPTTVGVSPGEPPEGVVCG